MGQRALFSKDWFDAYLCGGTGVEERRRGSELVRILKRPGFGFQLEIYLNTAIAGLDLLHPSLKVPVEIGYADQAHWFPWALRVKEVEALCAIAAVEPSCAHPAEVARVLLAPFTLPVTSAEGDAQWIVMQHALGVLGFSHEEVVRLRDRRAFHFNGLGRLLELQHEWVIRDGGWVLDGNRSTLYSYRTAHQPNFPHAQLAELFG